MFQELKLYITYVFYEIECIYQELKLYITDDLNKIYLIFKYNNAQITNAQITNTQITNAQITNTNHKYLRYTNLLLIVTIFYFLLNKHKPLIEYILASSFIPTIIFSQLFWNNPIKHSIIHKIDAIIAKIVIFSCISYTLYYKYCFSFLLVLLLIAVSFIFSNHYSKQEWCSNRHIICHGSGHIFCFIATIYTFSPLLI